MTITLKDMASGVVAIKDVDGFPYETLPPQGTVEITFGTGNRASVSADIDDFREAEAILHSRQDAEYHTCVLREQSVIDDIKAQKNKSKESQ